jgi:hypothetical protein
MAVPGTPGQTLRPPEVVHTRPEGPNTPSLANLRTTKRHRQAEASPIPLTLGGGANKRQLVTGAVTEKITAAQEAAKTRHSIITAIANAIDQCLESYTSTAERLVAQELQQRVVHALTSSIYHPSTTTPQPASGAGSQPTRTYADVAKPPNSHSLQERGAAITNTAVTHRNGVTLNKPPNKPVPDSRILFQLSTAQRAKQPSPFVMRKALCARINNLTLQDIPRLTTTKTGWALTPANDTIKRRLLQPDSVEIMLETLGAVGYQLPEKWINYAVQRVEAALIGLRIGGDAAVPISEENVAEEVYSQTGVKPRTCKQSRHGPDRFGTITWIISFAERVRPFRIFGTSEWAKEIKKNPPVAIHNPGCQGYCNTSRCTRAARCDNCSQLVTGHSGAIGTGCAQRARCANCHGPHPATDKNCPAKPYYYQGKLIRLTSKQLQSVRRAGNRAYQRTGQTQDTEGDTATEPIVIAEEQSSQDSQPALQQPLLRATQSGQAKRTQQEETPTGTDSATATVTATDTDTATATTTASQKPQSRRPRRAAAPRESLSLAALSTRSLRTEHTVSTPPEAMIQADLSSTIEDTEMNEDALQW